MLTFFFVFNLTSLFVLLMTWAKFELFWLLHNGKHWLQFNIKVIVQKATELPKQNIAVIHTDID